MPLKTLPILDLSDLSTPSRAASFRAALRAATHDVGFFYLTNTGLPTSLETRMLATARAFFALPETSKLAIENTHSPHFRGYTRLGGERTLGAVDWREQIDICPEGVALTPDERRGKAPFERLVGPNLWPEDMPELREVVEEWQRVMGDVARRLMGAWAEALGEKGDFFDESFGEPFTLLKIVRYPSVGPPPSEGQGYQAGGGERGAEKDRTEKNKGGAGGTGGTDQGVGAHKDAGVLTLLWIEPGKAGLQVRHGDGWIDAPPVPGALVVNIGEMLEYATQGYLKATTHRVLAPRGGDRISVPFFFNPALDARLPLVRLPEGMEAAPGVSQDPSNPIHALYGENCLKSRLRAHPNVAQAHYADLVGA